MNQDRTKWNKRYLDKTKGEPTPPVFLINNWQLLTPGRVLDVAAGDGAASLFLAQKTGFRVTAVDIAEEGLKRLSAFAAQRDCTIETCCIDLDQAEQINSLGCFDSVVISYFKPSPVMFNQLIKQISPGGTLLITTYNLQHHETKGFPARFCLAPGELQRISSRLQLVKYESESGEKGCFDSYLFEKLP
ncbi:MAG: methyltransferase domain-containing protein [Amphritea sp.]